MVLAGVLWIIHFLYNIYFSLQAHIKSKVITIHLKNTSVIAPAQAAGVARRAPFARRSNPTLHFHMQYSMRLLRRQTPAARNDGAGDF
jgi:hypothetical protein